MKLPDSIVPAFSAPVLDGPWHLHNCARCGEDFRCEMPCKDRDPRFLLCVGCCIEIMRSLESGALDTVLRPIWPEAGEGVVSRTKAVGAGAKEGR